MAAAIQGQTATSIRWQMALGDGTSEGGGNSGSDFRLQRYSDAGTLIDVPLWIKRNNGVVTITGSPPDQGPILVINKTSGGGTQSSSIQGQTLTSTRWHLALGDGGAEAGANSGSDFRVHRHDDSGNFISAAMYIKRSDGQFAIFNSHAYKTGGGLWEDNSDARIKNVTGTYAVGLAAILQLQPKKFTYKGNDVVPSQVNVPGMSSPGGTPDRRSGHYQAAVDQTEFIGLIAQDVETAMPEMVRQVPALIDNAQVQDLRVLDTSALIYALVNAVKELAARVAALEGTTVTSQRSEGDP